MTWSWETKNLIYAGGNCYTDMTTAVYESQSERLCDWLSSPNRTWQNQAQRRNPHSNPPCYDHRVLEAESWKASNMDLDFLKNFNNLIHKLIKKV